MPSLSVASRSIAAERNSASVGWGLGRPQSKAHDVTRNLEMEPASIVRMSAAVPRSPVPSCVATRSKSGVVMTVSPLLTSTSLPSSVAMTLQRPARKSDASQAPQPILAALPQAADGYPQPELVEQLIASFLGSLGGCGVSSATLKAYIADVRQFAGWLVCHSIQLERVGTPHVLQYIEQLADYPGIGGAKRQPFAKATIARKLAALRRFFRFLVENGLAADNPAVVHPRSTLGGAPPRRVQLHISVESLRRLLCSPDPGSPRGIRDRAILALLLPCGLTAAELSALDVQDFDASSATLRVHISNRRPRVVPLADQVLQRLEAWMKVRQLSGASDGALFISMTSPAAHAARHGRLGVRRVSAIIERHASASGFPKPSCGGRALRRLSATWLARHGASTQDTRLFLGMTHRLARACEGASADLMAMPTPADPHRVTSMSDHQSQLTLSRIDESRMEA
jgi:site-specific recombinase XerD